MKTLQLTKQSSENEIKDYFKAVLKLSKSKEEFPVNLEDVWPLVYTKKSDAVEALRRDFIEREDFIAIRQNPQPDSQWVNPNPKIDYFISVSCLEYFIVKKVRPVFEVYRRVFHKAAEKINLMPTPTRIKTSLEWVKGVKEILNLNDSSTLFMLKQVGEPLGLPTPDYTPSKGQLLSPTVLLQQNGLNISTREFNQKMIEAGLIQELSRPSSNGKIKYFKSLTEKAAGFGENQVNPSNPKETQPLYYTDKFRCLLERLQLVSA